MADPNLIDLQALRVFLAAARERNMSTAASRLGITQSAVSQSVRALEDQLGVVLVNRAERPLSVTPAGLVLAERGTQLIEAAADLRNAVTATGQGALVQLRLGLVDSFAATCGAQLTRALMSETVRLSVRTGLSPTLGEGLLAREFDAIVTSDALEDSDDLARYPLLIEDFVVVTPKGALTEKPDAAVLRRLADSQSLIRFNQQSHLGMQIERAVRRCGIKASRRLEVDTADTLMSMVAEGLGWALATPLCVLQAADIAQHVDIWVPEPEIGSRELALLAREDQHKEVLRTTFRAAIEILRRDAQQRLGAFHSELGRAIRLSEIPPDPPPST